MQILTILLKVLCRNVDESLSKLRNDLLNGEQEVRMGSKHESNGQKKKLTKKEIKALNHAKLMANKGPSNVVELNAYKKDENKKAA